MNIKKSFRIAMAKKGAKQEEMAALIGVTPSTLSIIINKPSISTSRLEDLAKAFDMSVSEFVALGEE